MEDPWGSPWAAESPAKIDLPTAPQSAHFATDHLSPRRLSPGRGAQWNDDEAWGGWNDAASSGGGKESPRWGRSPGLKPLKTPSVRQLSPDPWRGVSLGELETEELERGVTRRRRDSERSRNGRVVDSAISLGDGEGLQEETSLKDGISILVPPLGLDVKAEDAWGTEEEKPEAPVEEHTSTTSVQLEQPGSDEAPVGLAVDLGHDLDRDRPPSRVQELVEMYDGIAKRSASPDTIPIAETKRQNTADEQFEEATDTLEPETNDLPPFDDGNGVHKHESSTAEDSETESEDEIQDQQEIAIAKSDEPQSAISKSPKPPPIPYPIDLSKLDDLFPSTKPATTEPEPVPDVIIDDTFASSSERNAWYRMSRFGSLRKHNLGDDENYVRVTWTGSEVRDRTIKIVRRWMEEDSITGRVVLGRRLGASGATMFNWDSSAPPVEIGELLGRNGRHSRQVSLRSPVVSPTAVSFGWTSSMPSSPTAAKHPRAAEVQQTSPPKPLPIAPPVSGTPRHSLILEKPVTQTSPPPPPPVQPLSIVNTNKDEDDDDDWGEMVSSPTVGNNGMASFSTTMTGFGEALIPGPQSHATVPNKTFDDFAPTFEKKDAISDQAPDAWDFGHFEANSGRKPTIVTPTAALFPVESSKPAVIPHMPSINANTTITMEGPTEPSISTQDPSVSDEEIVASILRNLPNLSYMLR